MDFKQIEQVVQAIELPLGLKLKLYQSNLTALYPSTYLRVYDDSAKCAVTGNTMPVCQGRRWEISDSMLPGEVVQTAWAAVQMYVEHEMREAFKYKGYAIFGPHLNIDRLVELASSADGIVVREEYTPKKPQVATEHSRLPAFCISVSGEAYWAAFLAEQQARIAGDIFPRMISDVHYNIVRGGDTVGGIRIRYDGEYRAFWTSDAELIPWIESVAERTAARIQKSSR